MTTADLHGRTLQGGKFQLIELLAEGGMASVWSAQMRSLDRLVAVKVLSPALAQNASFREQFKTEAHRIAQLHHANIIEVYDCEAEDDLMYIAMRYVPGGSLTEYIKRLDGPMDLPLAAKLTSQLASALQAVHDEGLFHQDVKPANVLLGRADWPLLSDFGIAGTGTREERGGHITGTPPYMSPEQWQNAQLTAATDQYSLAVMFYQLVTRELPFQATTRDELRQQVLTQQPRRPREVNPGIPGPVEAVMLRALEKRPADRFESIGDFSSALVEAVERSRGMQLETKQAVVESAAGLAAVFGLAILSPALVSLADANVRVFNGLTLEAPILLLVGLLQAAVLFGIRWQLIGLLGRAFGSGLDALDRITRAYARLGTDPRGPLNVQQWRNAVVSSAEYIVNIVYVLVLYVILGVPISQIVSQIWEISPDVLTTAFAALLLVLLGANLLAMWRVTGIVMATLALAVCWVFVGSMPLVDRTGFGGISLQWATKLLIGIDVVAALLSLRKRVQATVATAFPATARRWSDALVNLVYLLVTFPILAVPLRKLLEPLTSVTIAAVVITVLGALLVLVMVDVLRRAQGLALAIVGLFVCTPMLLSLPLWESGAIGSNLQWVVRLFIGVGVLALLIGLRARAQITARMLLVPALDRQISALYAPRTEAAAEARLHLLERVSDGLIDVLYVLAAYIAIVAPLTGVLADSSLSWLTTVVYLVFAAVAVWLLYRVWRNAGAAGFATPAEPVPQPA